MKFAKPKLLPTIVCLTLVGLVAAVLPYPGLVNGLAVVGSESSK